MYGLTLAALTVLLPIGLVKSLDCLTGRTGFGLIYTKCNPGINYCAKGTAVDPVYGHVIDKGCDTENFCDVC
uniref:Uncharacterized protein n=1 Tax=Setaria digitata TaxID=48799 RepID=A0A915PPZ6_9BILA